MAGIAVIAVVAWESLLAVPFPTDALGKHTTSTRVVDRTGRLLRDVPNQHGERGQWVPLAEVSPLFLRVLTAVEDRRFREHAGVDWRAALRALLVDVRERRAALGASTLTMQVVRMLRPHPKTLRGKWGEMVDALRLERAITKDAVLEQYVNRAPFANNLIGVESAAQAYFGHSAKELSLGEAALLAGLPQSPSRLNPWRSPREARARLHRVLTVAVNQGIATDSEARAAEAELLVLPRHDVDLAPQAVAAALEAVQPGASARELRTSVDLRVQAEVNRVLGAHRERVRELGVENCAVVVLANDSAEVLALVGQFPGERWGQNLPFVRRQAGSTLKPFLYALALDNGYSLDDVLLDAPGTFADSGGPFAPRNFDGKFRGAVSLRAALAGSLNVPAVRLEEKLGQERLYQLLRALHFDGLRRPPQEYGLGLALGDVEVSALELATAYSALARGGSWRAPRLVLGVDGVPAPPGDAGPPLFTEVSASAVTRALSDSTLRAAVFGPQSAFELAVPVAFKTGTSSGSRDFWAAGFTRRFTAVVWLGKASGAPLEESSFAMMAAAPVVADLFNLLEAQQPP